jgi:hypothetical protein
MKNTGRMMFLLVSVTGVAFAGQILTPEIDASTGVSAVALLAGAFIILRARRRR